jgi:hypothetical protein
MPSGGASHRKSAGKPSSSVEVQAEAVRELQQCDDALLEVLLAPPLERDLKRLRQLTRLRHALLRRLHLNGMTKPSEPG